MYGDRIIEEGRPMPRGRTCAGSHLEVELLVSEPKILRGHKAGQEDVDAFSDGERHGHHTICRGSAIQTADVVYTE